MIWPAKADRCGRRVPRGWLVDLGRASRGYVEDVAEIWTALRDPQRHESPFVGPFTSREEAEEWAEEQKRQIRMIQDTRRLHFPGRATPTPDEPKSARALARK